MIDGGIPMLINLFGEQVISKGAIRNNHKQGMMNREPRIYWEWFILFDPTLVTSATYCQTQSSLYTWNNQRPEHIYSTTTCRLRDRKFERKFLSSKQVYRYAYGTYNSMYIIIFMYIYIIYILSSYQISKKWTVYYPWSKIYHITCILSICYLSMIYRFAP